MTLRMERFSMRRGTRIRLSGELRNEQLNDLRTELERGGPQVTLDLDVAAHLKARFFDHTPVQD